MAVGSYFTARRGVFASGNIVQGNMVGTDATGELPVGDATFGIWLDVYSANSLIGGVEAGTRNVLSGNGKRGSS